MLTEEKWADRIELNRKKEHFIFTVQSVGFHEPEILFCKALDELIAKCDALLERV